MKLITLLGFIFFYNAVYAGNESPTQKQSFYFKENKGQVSDQFHNPRPDVLFYGRAGELDFHFRKNGISYQLQKVDSWKSMESKVNLHPINWQETDSVPDLISFYRIDVNWLNADNFASVVKTGASSDFENYYSECAPFGVLNIRSFEKITYNNIYPGIDLEWLEKDGQLKYNYHIAAGSDYKQIQLEYKGADEMSVNLNGDLLVKTPFGEIIERRPVVFQGNKQLRSRWELNGNIVSFEIEGLDKSLPFTIDPIIRLFGSLYGGLYRDVGMIVTDNVGNFYLFGETSSSGNIATSGSYQSSYAGGSTWGDAFVAKFDILGVRQWATYYGGAQSDFANWCTLDNSGNIYMVGGTSSTNSAVMATAGSHQSVSPGPAGTSMGTNDAFLAKFNSSGQRVWGSYYGGTDPDWAYSVDVDPISGDFVVTGCSYSSNGIATSGCHQSALSGTNSADGFIARFTSGGSRIWGTYYGGSSGSQEDFGWCSFTSNGEIYIVGNSASTNNISTPGSYQPVIGGSTDAVLAKFTGTGSLLWATYYGSSSNDIFAVGTIDPSDNVYIYGVTNSTLASIYTTPGAHQPTYGGGPRDCYLAKFDPSGNRIWGTYYGGAGNEDIGIPTVSSSGDIYLCGITTVNSAVGTAIATPCAYQNNYGGGGTDGFFAKFNSSGVRMWGTLYGGGAADALYTASIDFHGSLYVCGQTSSFVSATAFTTTGAHQTAFGGVPYDVFFAKFDGCAPLSPANNTPQHQLHICTGKTATLSTDCGSWYADSLSTIALGTGSVFTTGPLTNDTTFYIEETSCGFSIGRTPVHLTVTPLPNITIQTSNTTVCIAENVNLIASGASTYTWQGLNPGAADSINPVQVWVIIPVSYTVTGTDVYGCKNTASINIVPEICIGIEEQKKLSVFSLAPNPNNGVIRIKSSDKIYLELSNQLGEKIRTIRIEAGESELNLSDLNIGIYFLTETNTGQSSKIVVTR
ncbi:MAG: T9SS type A sorting domain-containing protein [Bacteroidia bacterium]|nr:T9SS type A sorting domain-containing protein [Bacteroidia bacterium]